MRHTVERLRSSAAAVAGGSECPETRSGDALLARRIQHLGETQQRYHFHAVHASAEQVTEVPTVAGDEVVAATVDRGAQERTVWRSNAGNHEERLSARLRLDEESGWTTSMHGVHGVARPQPRARIALHFETRKSVDSSVDPCHSEGELNFGRYALERPRKRTGPISSARQIPAWPTANDAGRARRDSVQRDAARVATTRVG